MGLIEQPVKMHIIMSAPLQFYSKVQYAYIACYNCMNYTWSGVSDRASAILRDVTFLAAIYLLDL